MRLIIRNASQILTVCSRGEKFLRGTDMNNVAVLSNATIVVGDDGNIADIGTASGMESKYKGVHFDTDIDATGKCIIPGFVDAHTHTVYAGDRVHEFAMKLAGATYMDIHKQGGGIGFTVRHVKESSENDLEQSLLARIDKMMRAGTTTVEVKSGYGLDAETELKMLRVIHSAQSKTPLTVLSTYLAHSVPKGITSAEATKDILDKQLPAVFAAMKEHKASPKYVDVFMEKNVFDADDTRAILQAGIDHGMLANFHGDELNYMGSAELAADVGAIGMSHCEKVSEGGMKAMADKNVVAELLPTTAYMLRIEPPPARQMITSNVIVSLASDYNPNAPCFSMPLVMHLACVLMRMTMPEAIVASTINAAYSLRLSDRYGSLEVGKAGDMLLIDAPTWEHIIYRFGENIITNVYKEGKCVC